MSTENEKRELAEKLISEGKRIEREGETLEYEGERLLHEVEDEEKHRHEKHVFHYKIDCEEQHTTERELTANQILKLAGIDPEDHYLVELKGHKQESYKDRGDASVHMHNCERFVKDNSSVCAIWPQQIALKQRLHPSRKSHSGDKVLSPVPYGEAATLLPRWRSA